MVVPPEQAPNQPRLQREAIFVIDTSGSMSGEPLKQAKEALRVAISTLHPQDTFNVIRFSDQPEKLFNAAKPADGAYLFEANRFIDSLDVNGGTEIARAVRAALENPAELSDQQVRQAVFITDGAVGNEDAVFKLIRSELGQTRLFTGESQ